MQAILSAQQLFQHDCLLCLSPVLSLHIMQLLIISSPNLQLFILDFLRTLWSSCASVSTTFALVQLTYFRMTLHFIVAIHHYYFSPRS